MSDIAVSIFKLENESNYIAPSLDIRYTEDKSDIQWIINCGGTRAYLIRVGENLNMDIDEQSADSHFMIKRITTTLLLSGCGLFHALSMGRLIFENIHTTSFNVSTHLDLWKKNIEDEEEYDINSEFTDWLKFICQNTLFRRAADDAYAALACPVEADFFIYRGMEWLLKAANIGWRELASDIGVSFSELKKYKRQINADLGQRHGVVSGEKRRVMALNTGSLVADFIYGLCNVRKRVDQNYLGISSKRAAKIVMKAVLGVPYP